MRFAFFVSVQLSLLACPVDLAAQASGEPSQSEMAAARALFQSGIEHGGAGRWTEALADFERSYAIVAIPVTLLNLAGAQAELGQVVAATESYRRFLAEATRGRARRYRSRAQASLAAAEARVAHLTLAIVDLGSGDTLAVDDDEVSRAMVGVAMPLDPGDHVVQVLRDGEPVVEERLTLADGAEQSLAMTVPPPAVQVAVRVDLSPTVEAEERPAVDLQDDSGGSVVSSPWLWTGVGVVVAGVVLTAVLVSQGEGQGTHMGNLGPGVITFD